MILINRIKCEKTYDQQPWAGDVITIQMKKMLELVNIRAHTSQCTHLSHINLSDFDECHASNQQYSLHSLYVNCLRTILTHVYTIFFVLTATNYVRTLAKNQKKKQKLKIHVKSPRKSIELPHQLNCKHYYIYTFLFHDTLIYINNILLLFLFTQSITWFIFT